jgi:hypothetical protein
MLYLRVIGGFSYQLVTFLCHLTLCLPLGRSPVMRLAPNISYFTISDLIRKWHKVEDLVCEIRGRITENAN